MGGCVASNGSHRRTLSERGCAAMDDLVDLDFAPAKPAAPVQSGAQAKYGGGRSAFDYLAGASAAQYAPSQPARTPTPQQTRAPTPRTQQSGDDAFSSLFGTSAASSFGVAQGAGLSMAERLQRESAAKIGGYAGLGAIGGGNGSLGAFPAQGGGAGSRAQCVIALLEIAKAAAGALTV